MAEKDTNLDGRIENCRGLLDVFQKERELLQSQQRIEPSSILHMLQLKLRLVDSVADCKAAMDAGDAPSGGDDGKRRERLRELGSLLEKLLVIERENQLLLRRLVASAAPPRRDAPAPTIAPAGVAPLVDRLQAIRNASPRSQRPGRNAAP